MLQIRPTCENCNTPLPPNSVDAMICSYECTFCKNCVENILFNVCPNCGGGFSLRPIRPSKNLKDNNYLDVNPATTKITHRPVDLKEHEDFSKEIRNILPENR